MVRDSENDMCGSRSTDEFCTGTNEGFPTLVAIKVSFKETYVKISAHGTLG